MLLLKDGVVLVGNRYTNAILQAVQTVYEARGWNTVITAGKDSHEHKISYHNDGRALDIRFWDVPVDQRERVAQAFRDKLPKYYDVVVEKDHYHIEADAKKEGVL